MKGKRTILIFLMAAMLVMAMPMSVFAAKADPNEDTTVYITPVEVPEDELTYVTPTQQAIIDACYTTKSSGAGWCAAWVSTVYYNAGCGWLPGNACDQWRKWCDEDIENIKPGMLIAVRHSRSYGEGYTYGHVGIYVGDGKVVHNIGNIEEWDILDWLEEYNWDGSAACGWPSEVRGKAHFEYCIYESEYLNYLIRVQRFQNDGKFIVFE